MSMPLIHMTHGSMPSIACIVDDFGIEHQHAFTQDDEPSYQASLLYLDGFSDPDFFEHVWRVQ